MKIDLKSLSLGHGRKRDFDYQSDLSALEFHGEHPFRDKVSIIGNLENNHGVVTLTATLTTTYYTVCGKCLEELVIPMELQIRNILTKDKDAEETLDVFIIENDVVELDEILLPQVVLEVDMVNYCREDCKGLCLKCGKNLNEGECGCDTHEVDDRLKVLQKLLDQTK